MPTPAAANVVLRTKSFDITVGGFEFTFTTTPGREYRVEASIDLNNWQPLDTFIASGATYTDVEAFPGPTAFYRAVLLP